jgi:hypothetical protein
VKAPSGHFFIDPDALNVPAVLIGGRHRHHADDEHAAVVPG